MPAPSSSTERSGPARGRWSWAVGPVSSWIRSSVGIDAQRVIVDLDAKASPGDLIGCRFRARHDTPRTEYLVTALYEMQGPAFCWAPRAAFPSTSFWYQVGYVRADGRGALYEPWVEIRLD